MSLLELQRDLHDWLRSGEDADAARFAAADRPGLDIYLNNYRASLSACLEESFAATRAWLGDDAFHDAVVAHVVQHAPSSWTLDAYTAHFPATLQLRYPEDPEVGELAAIELALANAFVAVDATPLTAADLATINWDHARFGFTPSLSRLTLTTNAEAIWAALNADETPPAATLRKTAAMLLVWRRDGLSCHRVTDADEARTLKLAQGGTTWAALCETLVRARGADGGVALAGQYLGRWLGDGLVTGIDDQPD